MDGTSGAPRAKGWYASQSAAGKSWSLEVLERVQQPRQRLAALNGPLDHGSRTRQARHAQLERMRSTVTAGALILAAGDERFTDFVLSRDYGVLRPLCSATHLKFGHLLAGLPGLERLGCQRLFERALEWLLSSSDLRQLDDDHLLTVPGAIAAMFVGPITFGEEFRSQWSSAYDGAARSGLIESRYIRMQLAIMGSYVGIWQPHVQWVIDPANRTLELGDAYLFVRKDSLPDTLQLQLRHLRGEHVPSRDCLYTPRPYSTLGLLIDYVCGCLRDTTHLESPGLTLMLLNFVDGVRAELHSNPGSARNDEAEGVGARLSKFEHIQVLEKRRFWRMTEALDCGSTRAHLVRLWHGSRGAPPNDGASADAAGERSTEE